MRRSTDDPAYLNDDEDEVLPASPNAFRPRWYDRLLNFVFHRLLVVHFVVTAPFRRMLWFCGFCGAVCSTHVERAVNYLLYRVRNLVWNWVDRCAAAKEKIRPSKRVDTVEAAVDQANKSDDLLDLVLAPCWRALFWLDAVTDKPGILRAARRGVRASTRLMVRTFHMIAAFGFSWLLTRPVGQLLFGLPAFLLILPLAYFAIRVPLQTNAAKANRYRAAVNEAILADDQASAELFIRKLHQLGQVHERVLFFEGLKAAEREDWSTAFEKMRQAAAAPPLGYAPAHFWIARYLEGHTQAMGQAQRMALQTYHLTETLRQQPDNVDAIFMLASIRLTMDDLPAAQSLLDRIDLQTQPASMVVAVAEMRRAVGQHEIARSLAEQAWRQLSAQYPRLARIADTSAHAKASRGVDPQRTQPADVEATVPPAADFLRAAVALELQGRAADGLKVLLQAHDHYRDDAEVARWAADAIVAQIDARTGSGQLGADFERSLKAYWERFPDDLRIQQRLARLAVELGITSVDQFLVPLADDGRLDVTAAHSLADGLVLKKQLDQALQLYRYVLERQPDNHLVLNNAAWVLAHVEPIDLAQAERLANRAVQLQPQDPHYRDTRGQIYVRLKQWHKAAEDLRMAINGLPHQSETHLALSVAYDHLGKKQLAEAYRRAARAGEPAP